MLWCAYWLARGEYHRWELWVLFFLLPALAWGTRATQRFFVGMYPMVLVGLLYDAMRFVQHVGLSPERVHVCDLRNLELRWFGIHQGTSAITLQDWLQAHWLPALDALAAIPYGTYLFVVIGYALYLYRKDFTGLQRYAWTFFALNVVGFLTYKLVPAAPPWYYHHYGCLVDVAAPASEGPNLARVDAWLGYAYFHGLYGRSQNVFGAVPSLHVSYPLLIVLEGWNKHRLPGRAAALAFFASMCFAAVYLDHHWVVDVLLGLGYCVIVYATVRAVFQLRAARATAALPIRGAANADPVLARVGPPAAGR